MTPFFCESILWFWSLPPPIPECARVEAVLTPVFLFFFPIYRSGNFFFTVSGGKSHPSLRPSFLLLRPEDPEVHELLWGLFKLFFSFPLFPYRQASSSRGKVSNNSANRVSGPAFPSSSMVRQLARRGPLNFGEPYGC